MKTITILFAVMLIPFAAGLAHEKVVRRPEACVVLAAVISRRMVHPLLALKRLPKQPASRNRENSRKRVAASNPPRR